MADELPSTTLGIPMEVTAILSTLDGNLYGKPVWTLARHRKGYSLKVFWSEVSPIGAHSTPANGTKKNRNLRRLEAFLLKKKGQTFHSSKPQAASGSYGTSGIPSVPQNNLEACPDNGVAMLSSAGAASQDSESNSKSDSSEPFAVASRSTPSLATPVQTASPVASRTRSKDLQKETVCSGGYSDYLLSDSKPASTSANSQVLQLPESLKGVTKHHEDFVKCADQHTADSVCECMREQWSDLLEPGRKVQVKIKDEFVDAVIEKPCFVSKISFDCHYFYATAKAEVKLAGTTTLRECQFRELTFVT